MYTMRTLYQNLVNLCVDNDTKFFFSDHITSLGNKMRVFSYHIANYSDWLMPDALEARGIMFEMDGEIPVRIASRPMAKFFNLSELQGWVGLSDLREGMVLPDLTKINFYMDKRDGSLISSFTDTDKTDGTSNVLLKSKTSIRSEQANDASVWLYDHEDLLDFTSDWENDGYTVNFEWTSPKNQIVLGYSEPELRILNVRNRDTGEYVDVQELLRDPVFVKYAVDLFEAPSDPAWVSSIGGMTGIEGFVISCGNMLIKVKTDWYVALHHTKDSINNNKRLIVCCAENCTDDLLQMFKDDEISLQKIRTFDKHFSDVVGETFGEIFRNYNQNKALIRKDYAIAMSRIFGPNKHWFSVAMQMYQDGPDGLVQKIVDVIKKYPEKFLPAGYSA
ncbi:hypothetical protein AHP1_1851 [Aeromonas phage Ahp1_CNU-2021]|nr:hypothetical protein AHP1_1851 [Aeromonas phage Ahp1_CNU-2021]